MPTVLAPDRRSVVCRHPATDRLFDAADYLSGDVFEIRRCASCGLTLSWPPLDEASLTAYYPTEYYGSRRRYRWRLDAVAGATAAWRASRLERWLGRRGRVLDIGCGPGHLLHALARRGWTVVGLERSDTAARQAREAFGLDVHAGSTDEMAWPSATFDAVVLWHVLEHVANPEALLGEARRLLTPDGVVLVGVPDIASAEARWAGRHWFHLDVPRHRSHFTEATLGAMLRRHGFRILATSRRAPEYDVFSVVQSILNRLGLPPNGLFLTLRRRDARAAAGSAASRWRTALGVVMAVPLTAVAVVWTTVAALCGAGATLTVYARSAPER